MNSKSVSIIIVNYNGLKHLKECFETLYKSDAKNAELIMVDNGSHDTSCEFMKEHFPNVVLIELDENTGFARANNIGVEKASGDYIVFLNNDTAVTKNWLTPLISTLETNPDIGNVGSKLMLYHYPDKVNSAGANLVFNGTGHDIGLFEPDSPELNQSGDHGAVCAACCMVRKKEFLELGGFDNDYFMYFEDTDLCWRYWLHDYRVYYNAESIVSHKFGGTSGSLSSNALRTFHGTRNSNYNIIKNLEWSNAIFSLLFNLFFRGANLVIFLFQGKFDCSYAVLRSYFSLIKNLGMILKKRKDVQSKRKVSDQFLFDNKLLISLKDAIKEFRRVNSSQHSK